MRRPASASPRRAVDRHADFDPTTGALARRAPTRLRGGSVASNLTLNMKGMVHLHFGLQGAGRVGERQYAERRRSGRDRHRRALHRLPGAVAGRDLQDPARLVRRESEISRRCRATSYMPSTDSGAVQVGFSTSGGMGTLVSGALESSTVEPSSELTAMIKSAARLYGQLERRPVRELLPTFSLRLRQDRSAFDRDVGARRFRRRRRRRRHLPAGGHRRRAGLHGGAGSGEIPRGARRGRAAHGGGMIFNSSAPRTGRKHNDGLG